MNPQILIVGDAMLDVHTRGRAERVCPEAPVLVLDVEREESSLGGAGAVAALLAGLGASPLLAGVVGDDAAGQEVARLVEELENRQSSAANYLFPTSDRPTTVKQRFLGSAAGRHAQPMLRVDRESRRPVPREIEDRLRSAALEALRRVQAVLISDYGKGVCTPRLLSAVIRAARRVRVPVLVDPRRGADYSLYRWATVIKPNRREASEAVGREIRCLAEAYAAGKQICARWGFQAAVITLDADGMALVTADGEEQHFRTCRREICDVTGAGDTVLAVLGRSLAEGRPLAEACELANVAAGLQVERLGVVPLTWKEIASQGPKPKSQELNPKSKIENPKSARGKIPSAGQFAISGLQSALDCYRATGRKIVFANGCFDLLHAGHIHCLKTAKELGDVLIVAVNSDAGVRRLKGPTRPVIGQQERATMLAALDCVDHVVIFDDDTPERLIAEIRPDVLVKGAEPRAEGVPGAEIVKLYGGEIVLVPLLADVSTTAIVKRLQSQASLPLDLPLDELAACSA